ncbi:ABC transporter permease [Chloroflexota bacterium]
MKFFESFIIALRSLVTNKLRSSLTMLGIIIGVGAVITLMSVGQGAQNSILSTYEQMGTNLLQVVSRSPDVTGLAALSPAFAPPNLTMDDAEALERLRSVEGVAPINENFVAVSAGDESKTSIIQGSTPEYQHLFDYSLALGRFITDGDVNARNRVVVLGSEVAGDLFGVDEAVGQSIKIKGHRFNVIGVLDVKGGAIMGVSLDNLVIVPITTFQTKLFTQRTAKGEDAVGSIMVKAASAEAIEGIKADIDTILTKRHRITGDEKADFAIVSQEQMMGFVSQITDVFTIFLGAISSISLVVGGIGIMNIMLVSVTERTREIGIRKAVGAKRRDILLQFLLEAGMLSFTGGAVGIIGGWLLSVLISQIDLGGITLNAVVSLDIVILAVSVSIIIGLISGIYPAMRAARLNPIDALHYQ